MIERKVGIEALDFTRERAHGHNLGRRGILRLPRNPSGPRVRFHHQNRANVIQVSFGERVGSRTPQSVLLQALGDGFGASRSPSGAWGALVRFWRGKRTTLTAAHDRQAAHRTGGRHEARNRPGPDLDSPSLTGSLALGRDEPVQRTVRYFALEGDVDRAKLSEILAELSQRGRQSTASSMDPRAPCLQAEDQFPGPRSSGRHDQRQGPWCGPMKKSCKRAEELAWTSFEGVSEHELPTILGQSATRLRDRHGQPHALVRIDRAGPQALLLSSRASSTRRRSPTASKNCSAPSMLETSASLRTDRGAPGLRAARKGIDDPEGPEGPAQAGGRPHAPSWPVKSSCSKIALDGWSPKACHPRPPRRGRLPQSPSSTRSRCTRWSKRQAWCRFETDFE